MPKNGLMIPPIEAGYGDKVGFGRDNSIEAGFLLKPWPETGRQLDKMEIEAAKDARLSAILRTDAPAIPWSAAQLMDPVKSY